jgi:hypothetical protein
MLVMIKITITEIDPVTELGLRFYTARAGYSSIEEYCIEQILSGLEAEETSGDYFKDLRAEIFTEVAD